MSTTTIAVTFFVQAGGVLAPPFQY